MSVLQRAEGWESLLEGNVWDHSNGGAPRVLAAAEVVRGQGAGPGLGADRRLRAQPEGFPATSFLALCEIHYHEGEPDIYFLPARAGRRPRGRATGPGGAGADHHPARRPRRGRRLAV